MFTITPDLVEWMVSDPQVVVSWRSIARYLDLETYIPRLEVTRRNRMTDNQRLKELMMVWRSVRPDTYKVEFLLDMLDVLVSYYNDSS